MVSKILTFGQAERGNKRPPDDGGGGPPPVAPEVKLQKHLSDIYSCDVLGRGAKSQKIQTLRTEVNSDSQLRQHASRQLSELVRVEKARGGRDYVTHKQIEYLTEVLSNG